MTTDKVFREVSREISEQPRGQDPVGMMPRWLRTIFPKENPQLYREDQVPGYGQLLNPTRSNPGVYTIQADREDGQTYLITVGETRRFDHVTIHEFLYGPGTTYFQVHRVDPKTRQIVYDPQSTIYTYPGMNANQSVNQLQELLKKAGYTTALTRITERPVERIDSNIQR